MKNLRNAKNRGDTRFPRKYISSCTYSFIKEKQKLTQVNDIQESHVRKNSLEVTEQIEDLEKTDIEIKWKEKPKMFRINCEIDILSLILFSFAILTRMYSLEEPKNIV